MGSDGGGGTTITAADLAESLFFDRVPDDILLNILGRLDEDPRDLARLVCVSTRFCKLIKTVCWKFKCEKTLPLLVAELLQAPSTALHPCPEPPGGWASLQKLLVCCPGLWHAGVLLENWDFGLDREIGRSDDFGYPDGPSLSDGLIAPESMMPELGYSHSCESVGNKSCGRVPNLVASTSTPLAVECSLKGSATCMVIPLKADVEAHVSGDVCGLGSVNSCTHYSEAAMKCAGNAGGKDCDNEADMGRSGKEACMSVSKVINSVAEECHVREHDFQQSAEEKDGALASMKEGAPHIHKSVSMQSRPKLLNSVPLLNDDPLNLVSVKAGCGHPSKEEAGLVDIHVNQMHLASSGATSHEKRMRECKPKSHRKRRKKCRNARCHIATRPWNLSREQGNKLLANRFRADSLYICDWPGCSHPGDKRIYKLFRGVFKNFKHSHVWRNLKDMRAKATNVGCAFCVCKSTWDMVTTFCLKRSIEYHDDGEPVVRAYVCENGHVAGAWTDRPMYTL